MNSYLTENQFFAPLAVISELVNADKLLIESNENYQKRSFRNRCLIDSAQGTLALSVPLSKGKNEKMPIRDVKINYDYDWQRHHLQSIKSSYGNAPYFEHLVDDINRIYATKHEYLFDLNYVIWQWVIAFVELDIDITTTNQYRREIPDPMVIDARNKIKTTNYKTMSYQYKPYVQVFAEHHPFIPNLSILDLMFCTGKASLTYLS